MSVPFWVADLAAEFWARAGQPGPFPRDLDDAAEFALPMSIIRQPMLCLTGVAGRMAREAFPLRIDWPDRPLRACVVAGAGWGFLFLDADDPPDEQRFSLAHEIAHFLRHYLAVRRRAVSLLGAGILEVLDGVRPPAPEERLHAVLREVPVVVHTHLLPRDSFGSPRGCIARAEQEADRLAWELLAPARTVLQRIGRGGVAVAAALLRGEFGLPEAQAEQYAAVLLPSPAPRDPLLVRLGKTFDDVSNFGPDAGN